MLPEHEVAQPSPVHAGIDRQLVAASRSRLRFPRTRGDRPVASYVSKTEVEVPRTRGDRPGNRPMKAHLKHGSPARAGIDRLR